MGEEEDRTAWRPGRGLQEVLDFGHYGQEWSSEDPGGATGFPLWSPSNTSNC